MYIRIQDCNGNGSIYHVSIIDIVPPGTDFENNVFIPTNSPEQDLIKIENKYSNLSASKNFYAFYADIDTVKNEIQKIIS